MTRRVAAQLQSARGARFWPRRSAFIAATAALAKCRRPQRKRKQVQKRAPRALCSCAATTLQHQDQPPPPQEPAADAAVAGPSNGLLMYLVLQVPPESDDESETN